MVRRLHFRIHLLDPAFRIDDERGPKDPLVFAAIQLLPSPGAVCLGHGVIGIHEQRKVEIVLVPEPLMRRAAVRAHPEHDRVARFEPGHAVPKAAGFPRATGGIVLRVEKEYHPLPAKRGQLDEISRIRFELEIGSWRSFVDHGCALRPALDPAIPGSAS